MTLFLIGVAAAVSTSLGGVFALRHRDRLHLILGFTAGAVMAVAILDLLAEAIELSVGNHQVLTVMALAVTGSIAYMSLDRILPRAGTQEAGKRGHLGAASLTLHSFLDGLAVGLAFKVSSKVGIPVAVAVLAHDFSDGINTVSISLSGGVLERGAKRWLVADAAAPLLGIAAASVIRIPDSSLSLVLALFSGFFLYIGWSELGPESYHRHPKIWTTLSTIVGVGAMYAVIRIAG
jgi:zinc transporter ZupT